MRTLPSPRPGGVPQAESDEAAVAVGDCAGACCTPGGAIAVRSIQVVRASVEGKKIGLKVVPELDVGHLGQQNS